MAATIRNKKQKKWSALKTQFSIRYLIMGEGERANERTDEVRTVRVHESDKTWFNGSLEISQKETSTSEYVMRKVRQNEVRGKAI